MKHGKDNAAKWTTCLHCSRGKNIFGDGSQDVGWFVPHVLLSFSCVGAIRNPEASRCILGRSELFQTKSALLPFQSQHIPKPGPHIYHKLWQPGRLLNHLCWKWGFPFLGLIGNEPESIWPLEPVLVECRHSALDFDGFSMVFHLVLTRTSSNTLKGHWWNM